MLKRISTGAKTDAIGEIRYISPERGGLLQYDPNVDNNIGQNPAWLQDSRRQNQAQQFRQQSVTLYRRLELLALREIDADRSKPSFSHVIDQLNMLLASQRRELAPDKTGRSAFKIKMRGTDDEARPEDVSSGESELISLGIEILSFVREITPERENVLLIDEPDVHLHPDLQDRLARFITKALNDKPITLIVATHSTPLLAGLAADETTTLAFMRPGATDLTFKPVTEVDRTILPIFGAHPLSNIFNQSPVLIVEGGDDERIWQQVVRTSKGRVRLFPCVATSVDKIGDFEREVNNIIDAVYDRAQAFSLRDHRDRDPEMIDDLGYIVRMRLRLPHTAENLMLSDEVLAVSNRRLAGATGGDRGVGLNITPATNTDPRCKSS